VGESLDRNHQAVSETIETAPGQRARFGDNGISAHLAVRGRGQAPQPRSGAPKAPGLRSASHRQTINRAGRPIDRVPICKHSRHANPIDTTRKVPIQLRSSEEVPAETKKCLQSVGDHLASAIGLALVENGWRVLFARTSDLVQRLQVARRELALEAAINRLDRFNLLILDDLAYVSKDQAETSVLFELISARYERRSTLITANQPFGAWGKVFPDSTLS
jgi:hypothetical protein